MHIILGFLSLITATAWAIYALGRAGIHISSFNPFAMARRMAWRKRCNQNPLYTLDPFGVVGVLLIGMAKCKGEISSEQKSEIMKCLIGEMQLTEDDAAELMVSSAFLTKDEVYIADKIGKILSPIQSQLTNSHKESIVKMLTMVGEVEGKLNTEQQKLLENVVKIFSKLDPAEKFAKL